MKYTFSFITFIVGVIVISSCNGSALQKKWEAERDSLVNINTQQKEVLDDMTSTIVEISNIIDTINMQERLLVSAFDLEGRRYTRKQIVENLKTFENILIEKRRQIHVLDSMMSKKNDQIKQLSNLISYLNGEIDKKDVTIQSLRAELASKNSNIRNLNEAITSLNADVETLNDSLSAVNEIASAQEETIKEKDDELNVVYYIIGTKKELTDKGVLTKGGLFKKSKVNANSLSAAHKSDARDLTSIIINGDKPSILTNIPSNSYKLNKVSDKMFRLEILDKDKFWSVSKLLIIQVK